MKKIILTEDQLKSVLNEIDNNIYFSTFSGAVARAKEYAESKGYIIDDEDWWSEISVGPGRPKEGKTTRVDIGLLKNDKRQRKMLHIQVYNRGNQYEHNFELNYYIS